MHRRQSGKAFMQGKARLGPPKKTMYSGHVYEENKLLDKTLIKINLTPQRAVYRQRPLSAHPSLPRRSTGTIPMHGVAAASL